MEINLDIKKSYLIALILFALISFGVGYVIAYGTSNPSNMGHNFGEVSWTCRQQSGSTSGYLVSAGCSPDEKLVSGGCWSTSNSWPLLANMPDPNNPTMWQCRISTVVTGNTLTAYARCCK